MTDSQNKKWFVLTRRFAGLLVIVLSIFLDIPPELKDSLPELLVGVNEAIGVIVGAAVMIWGHIKRDKEKKLSVLPASAELPWKKK